MSIKVIIFGVGELSEINHFYLTHDSPYQVEAFTVDQDYIKEDLLHGLPIIPFESVENEFDPEEHDMSVLIGFRGLNQLRSQKYFQSKAKGYKLINYVSSKATVWNGLRIGDNCYIHENSIVQPFATIGNNVVISAGSIVGHHSDIEDHCFLSARSAILGGAKVKPYCIVGANATVMDGVTLERDCVIGSGAVVSSNAREGEFYIGAQSQRLSVNSRKLPSLLTWTQDMQRASNSRRKGSQD